MTKKSTLTVVTFIGVDKFKEATGAIPGFLDPEDPRDVVDQINERYAHGGGWIDLVTGEGAWELRPLGNLAHPGDPELSPLGFTKIREELVFFYNHGMVVILAKTGDFRVARLD